MLKIVYNPFYDPRGFIAGFYIAASDNGIKWKSISRGNPTDNIAFGTYKDAQMAMEILIKNNLDKSSNIIHFIEEKGGYLGQGYIELKKLMVENLRW